MRKQKQCFSVKSIEKRLFRECIILSRLAEKANWKVYIYKNQYTPVIKL
jgi:hypothetical protein